MFWVWWHLLGLLLRASKSSCLALIVERPRMLHKSAGRSLGSLDGLKLCHRSNQIYKWLSPKQNMKHGSNLRHPHRLPTWLLLQVHMSFLLLDRHGLLTRGLRLIWMEPLQPSPPLLLPPHIHPYPLQMVVHALLKGMDRQNLLPPLLYIMFYMFLAFPLTFFLLVPLTVYLIVLSFSTLSIVSSKTFVLARELVWGVRMVVGSMSSCRSPLPLGC